MLNSSVLKRTAATRSIRIGSPASSLPSF